MKIIRVILQCLEREEKKRSNNGRGRRDKRQPLFTPPVRSQPPGQPSPRLPGREVFYLLPQFKRYKERENNQNTELTTEYVEYLYA